MRGPVDLDLVKATLAARVDSLVPQLYPAAVRDRAHWRLGDIYGAPGQSLAITRTGAHAGCFKDFGGTAQGSALDLIAHALFAGEVNHEVVAWAANWCGLGSLSPAEQKHAAENAQAAARRAAAAEREQREQKQRSAVALWLGGQRIPGTPAEHYFLGRAIDFAGMGHYPGALRYGAEVYNSELRAHVPAVLAYVYDPEARRQVATHRTYLARDSAGLWRKNAQLTDAKKTLGPFKGGHIPVWRGQHNGPLHELPDGTWVVTAEGIENSASVAAEAADHRCIAHISVNNLGELKLPPNIGGLFIARDNDKPGSDADRAMAQQLERLEARGVPFKLISAPQPHKDMNDWRQATAAARRTEQGAA